MKYEFILALLSNLKCGLTLLAIVSGFGLCMVALFTFADSPYDENEKKEHYKRGFSIMKKFAFAFFTLGAICCIPDLNDIWKIRIGLIKYRLASPENVENSVKTIERIGHELECKYLACKEEKK